MRSILPAVLLSLMVASRAAAQGWVPPDPTSEPWNNAKMKFGPIFVAPSFDLRDIGIDDNVFRDNEHPARDLTATIAVSTLFGVHFKAFTFSVAQDNRYVWFRRYSSERSIDGGLKSLFELRFRTFHPWLIVSNLKSRARSGYEIDSRAPRREPFVEAGADMSFGFRTGMTVSFRREETIYDEDQFFDGSNLKETLDKRSTFAHAAGKWQYSLSTDLLAGVEWTKTEFTFSPLRDSTSLFYFGGFGTRGDAPLSGSLQVGFKTQVHDDPAVKDFRGLVVNAALSTVVFDRVKLDFGADRDLKYSYDKGFPFYLQQGANIAAVVRVATRLDLLVSGRGEWLRYSDPIIQDEVLVRDRTARTDIASAVGIGFQYRMIGQNSHFGLTLEQAGRDSSITAKNFKNRRILTDMKLAF